MLKQAENSVKIEGILSEIDFTVLSEICSTDTSEKINKIIAITIIKNCIVKSSF